MSDRPLFQDADEQEATYAPQQVPGEADQVAADEGAADREVDVPVAALPIAASGAAANTAGPGYAGGSAGTVSGLAPAVGAVALANEIEKQDEPERRD
jgi:hypothetical protein